MNSIELNYKKRLLIRWLVQQAIQASKQFKISELKIKSKQFDQKIMEYGLDQDKNRSTKFINSGFQKYQSSGMGLIYDTNIKAISDFVRVNMDPQKRKT